MKKSHDGASDIEQFVLIDKKNSVIMPSDKSQINHLVPPYSDLSSLKDYDAEAKLLL